MTQRLIDVVIWLNRRMPGNVSATWPLAMARVALGLLWLGALRWKLPPDFVSGGERGLPRWIELAVQHPTFDWYGGLLESMVLGNHRFWGWLLFLAELVVGVALVFGAWTRVAAFAGLIMSINLLLAVSDVPGVWPWSYLLMAILHAVVLLSDADELWSIDASYHR